MRVQIERALALARGEMAERLIASISKVVLALANEGSNPSFSTGLHRCLPSCETLSYP